MSETGATAEQIEAAVERYYADIDLESVHPDHRTLTTLGIAQWSQYLIPPGYQIVPAGAVVLSAEEAATAREALIFATEHGDVVDAETYAEHCRLLEPYRALAAKLSGGAS